MTDSGWGTKRPAQTGLYDMRKTGRDDERLGTIEVVSPGKYRKGENGEIKDIPLDGYEYRVATPNP